MGLCYYWRAKANQWANHLITRQMYERDGKNHSLKEPTYLYLGGASELLEGWNWEEESRHW